MNIRLNYGTAVATIPAAALAVMDRATKHDLKVLLTLGLYTREREGREAYIYKRSL